MAINIFNKLLSRIYQSKESHRPRLIGSDAFSAINESYPLCLNHNIKKPHLLSISDLKGGLLIDGTVERAVHGASSLFLSQLLGYKEVNRGFIAFMDHDADFPESVFGAAAYYGKKGWVLLIDDDNSDSITPLLLRTTIEKGGYIIVKFGAATSSDMKSRQVTIKELITKVHEAIKVSSVAEDSLFTIYLSVPFFKRYGLLNAISTLDEHAQEAGWGRIVTDGNLALNNHGVTLNHSKHLCFAAPANAPFGKRRKRLKDNYYLMANNGSLESKTPERGMLCYVRDYDFKTYEPTSRSREFTVLK